MQKNSLGSLQVSEIGLGCNQFGRKIDIDASKSVIDAALDSGINYLDTSDRYGYGDLPFSGHGRSEEFIGQALKGCRDQVVLATKFGNPMGDDPANRGGSRRYVRIAIEASLARLQVDHIDLYQIHRPDESTPIEETLGALNELIQEGKVREIGCSNFTVAQLTEAAEVAATNDLQGFVSVQNEYSLLHRTPEEGVLDVCAKHQIGFIPYFPLASGLLTGKYVKGQPPPSDSRLANFKPNRPHLALDEANLDKAGRLSEFAESRGHTLVELAFAWLLARPEVASVIAGATKPEQIRANAATPSWRLTNEDLAELDKI
jgi:aryl-alcohol dehydrogenase-like predicted oxidoreductase